LSFLIILFLFFILFTNNLSSLVLFLCFLLLRVSKSVLSKSSRVYLFILLLTYITGVLILFFYIRLIIKPFKRKAPLKGFFFWFSISLFGLIFFKLNQGSSVKPIILNFEQYFSYKIFLVLGLLLLGLLYTSLILRKIKFLRQVN
jgi:hypothetical protein